MRTDRDDDRALPASRRRGTVLAAVLIMIVLIALLASALLQAVHAQGRVMAEGQEHASVLRLADDGLAKGKAKLIYELTDNWAATSLEALPADPTGAPASEQDFIPAGPGTDLDGIDLNIVKLSGAVPGPYEFLLRSQAAHPRAGARQVEAVMRVELRWEPVIAPSPPELAAIVAYGDVVVTGNVEVDGNDHYPDGARTPDDLDGDAVAVITPGSMSIASNSATLGGAGEDPVRRGQVEDGVHYDDGASLDVPADVGALLQVPTEHLIRQAQEEGTYFQLDLSGAAGYSSPPSAADITSALLPYNTYVHDDPPPEVAQGGQILVLEVDNTDPASHPFGRDLDGDGVPETIDLTYRDPNGGTVSTDLWLPANPSGAGGAPSIVIVVGKDPTNHNVRVGTIKFNNTQFQGLFVADQITNMEGNGTILGSVVSFNQQQSEVFEIAAGTPSFKYSSQVLRSLPLVTTGEVDYTQPPDAATLTVVEWREVAPR